MTKSRRTVLILLFGIFLMNLKGSCLNVGENSDFEDDKIVTSTGRSDHKFTSKIDTKQPVILAEQKEAGKNDCNCLKSIAVDEKKKNEIMKLSSKPFAVINEILEEAETDTNTNSSSSDGEDEDDNLMNDLEQLRIILRSLQQILLFLAAVTFSFILFYTAFYINVLRKIYIKPHSSCIKKK